MKKLMMIAILFLLVGCSNQNDPIDEYIKENIILEVGSKVTIQNIVDLKKVENEELLKSLKNATVNIEYKNNEKIDGKVKKDKIYATNVVQVKYDYNDKDYEAIIDVSIRDSVKPKIKIKNTYLYTPLNKPRTQEEMIKDLKLKIKDKSDYKIELLNYKKIDFTKVSENKVVIKVSDAGNNIVEKKIKIFVGEPPAVYILSRKGLDGNKLYYIHMYLPSTITSRYSINYMANKEKDNWLRFTNNEEELVLYYSPVMEYYRHKITKEYTLNNVNITIFKPVKKYVDGSKNPEYGKTNNMAFITHNRNYEDNPNKISVYVNKGEQMNQIEWFANEIALNSYVYK